jgi:MFS family permease
VAAPTTEAVPDRRVPGQVAALGYRDYRWFWVASVVSNTGSMMHMAALNWVVADLPGVTAATFVAGVGLIPMLVSSPIGGAIADRYERRLVFLWAVVLQMLTAAALALAYEAGWTSVGTFVALAVIGGFTGSIGAPVQQAIITDLVPVAAMRNASVLNSTQFTVSRSLGPTLAGVLIGPLGAGTVFWANTVSFAVLIVGLNRMERRPPPSRPSDAEGYVAAFRSGCRYTLGNAGLRVTLLAGFIVALVSSPLQLNGQVIAKEAFDAGPTAFGLLVGAFGYGSLVSALGVLAFDRGWTHRGLVLTGFPLFAAGLFGLSVSPVVALGIVANAVVGIAFMILMSTILSATHALCDDEYRGRVMSVWMLLWGVAAPIGIAVTGLAEVIGIRWILAGFAVLLAGFTLLARARGSFDLIDPPTPGQDPHARHPDETDADETDADETDADETDAAATRA